VTASAPRPLAAPRLPTFLLIGAMKAGTTSLHEYLAEHPQIFMSRIKELNFFTEAHNWPRGLTWYEEQFTDAGDSAVAVGESSTAYTQYPRHGGVPGRVAQLLPDVRLIYLVRHPIDRIRSQYLHDVGLGKERDPIEKALRVNPVYVDFSRYALQIEQYLKIFDRDRLLVLDLRELRDDREGVMDRVFRFLDVNSSFMPSGLERKHNVSAERSQYRPGLLSLRRSRGLGGLLARVPGPVKRMLRPVTTRKHDSGVTISPGLRRELEDRLQDDVGRLRAYMDEGFDGWGIG
jgi:Sulfotransferase domain